METFSLLTIVKNVEVWIFAMVIVNGAMAIVFFGVSFYFRKSQFISLRTLKIQLRSSKLGLEEGISNHFVLYALIKVCENHM